MSIGFTVYGLKKSTDETGECKDSYQDLDTAIEFATDLVESWGYFDGYIVDWNGVRLWGARENGIRKVRQL